MTPERWNNAKFDQRVAWCRRSGYSYLGARRTASQSWRDLGVQTQKRIEKANPSISTQVL